MIVLSLTISSRYFWWRMTTTLDWSSGTDITAGLLLLFAELYAFLILLLGYFQVAWPLHRKPPENYQVDLIAMANGGRLYPHVQRAPDRLSSQPSWPPWGWIGHGID
jgi:hypothetical protein